MTAVLGLGALSFGVISGGAAGSGRPPALAALAVAACAFVAFVIAESRAAQPMVPLSLVRSGAVAAGAAIGFSINAAFYGIAFVLSLYFQRVLGEPAIRRG